MFSITTDEFNGTLIISLDNLATGTLREVNMTNVPIDHVLEVTMWQGERVPSNEHPYGTILLVR